MRWTPTAPRDRRAQPCPSSASRARHWRQSRPRRFPPPPKRLRPPANPRLPSRARRGPPPAHRPPRPPAALRSEGGAAVAAGEAPAGDVAAEAQAQLQHVDGSVIIRRGDTLWRISRRVYGRGVRYSTIYLANQDQISDPDRIWPGQVFNVPGQDS